MRVRAHGTDSRRRVVLASHSSGLLSGPHREDRKWCRHTGRARLVIGALFTSRHNVETRRDVDGTGVGQVGSDP